MLFPCARPIYPRASVPFLILEGRIIPRHELPRTMGLLSDADILQYVAKGEIGIEPFDAGNLTPNGYDVSVDEVVVPATEGKPDPNRIPPRARFAVSTRETIQLGRHVAGQIWLRTTWARRGVVASFGIIDAGFSGTLTFGAFNASSEPLELPIGERFAQVVFLTLESPASETYERRSGTYQYQKGVTFGRR
ncbi:MAG: dCTP deaminase [Methanobacteriota archaeon]|nr:MAG: dCTP deaminase [Euryarchaeota archaeon]